VLSFDSARQTTLPVTGYYDAVINLAMPSAAAAARDPEGEMRLAIATVQACLKLLDLGSTVRILHCSSFHVYGATQHTHYAETDIPAPTHPYGHIHLACERLLLTHPQTLVLRPTNIVAAPAHADLGDQAKLVFLDLCRQAAAGTMCLHNDGLSFRDFLPFDDALAAIRCLLNADLTGNRLFHLAWGQAQRLDAIAQLIQTAAPRQPVKLTVGTGQDAFRQAFNVDIERLAALGWKPQASLALEARRIIEFFA
jgi:nucleoside-diphosphate-sugar epimerase